jgi:hypothetical protein
MLSLRGLEKRTNQGDSKMTEFKSPELARRAFPILAASAAQRRLITYGELNHALDRRTMAVSLRTALGILGWWCNDNSLPTINCIVVNEETGEPGESVILRPHWSLARNQWEVFNRQWFTDGTMPTLRDLEQTWLRHRDQVVSEPLTS